MITDTISGVDAGTAKRSWDSHCARRAAIATMAHHRKPVTASPFHVCRRRC